MSQLKQQIEALVQRKIDGVINDIRQLQEVALVSIEQKKKAVIEELIQKIEAEKSNAGAFLNEQGKNYEKQAQAIVANAQAYIDHIGTSATDAAIKAERAAKQAVEAAETVQEFASAVAKINSLETRLKGLENQIVGEK